MENESNLKALFNPKAVAVIGASHEPGKVGYSVVSNMLLAGFEGPIYPVNPKGGELLGLKVLKDLSELPDDLDMAVLTIPRQGVVTTMQALAAKRLKSAVVITAGFKEVGKEGYYLEQELVRICKENKIALIGPNCLGIMDTSGKVNASFAADYPNKGFVGFFSQSGAICVSILDWAAGDNIGFSQFVSLGNKALIDEVDMLRYMSEDPNTKVILGYIENVTHGEDFIRVAGEVCKSKPVIMIKSGTTAAGAKAASSHTGAIAGSDNAYSAAFRKCGIIRVEDTESLFDLALSFASQPLPKGPNLAIVTNSGGPGIIASDACEKSKLNMAKISPETVDKLKAFLPPFANFYNPIDIIGDANAERYRKTLEVVVQDPQIHSILVLLSPTATAQIEETAQAIVDVGKTTDKPIFACFMGKKKVSAGWKILQDAGMVSFPEAGTVIKNIEAMYSYFMWRNNPEPTVPVIKGDKVAVSTVISRVLEKGGIEIVEFQAQEILNAYNLPTPKTILAKTSDEAVKAAEKIGFPVVLKIASPQISHKSDVGGVKAGLADAEAVKSAFWDITARAQRLRSEAYIAGCLVQEMAPKDSKEIIIGFKRDDQFGPLLMFGLGGIYVEVLKDISFRLAPLTLEDSRDMIREIKSYLLLKGVRGEAPVNFDAIENVLLTMSRLALDFPEIYEAEFNPVLVNKDRALVADVRLTLRS